MGLDDRITPRGNTSGSDAERVGGEVLVLQHLAAEDPGALGLLLVDAGMRLTTVELDEGEEIPDLEGFDLLLVMGGPMDVWEEDEHPWLVAEKAAIHSWVSELRRPYLGVCLGHQLLADGHGRVGRKDGGARNRGTGITLTPEACRTPSSRCCRKKSPASSGTTPRSSRCPPTA